MKLLAFALLLIIAVPASAATFMIPAEQFDWHTYPNDMSGYTEDAELENVRELSVGDQLHIRHWIDADLHNYATDLQGNGTTFEVCATVANLDEGTANRVRINHPNPVYNKVHDLVSHQYSTLCSKQGELGDVLRSAGVKVVSSSQGPVEVRDVFFRPIQASTQLTTQTSPSWELDLYRSAQSVRPNGRLTYEINEQAWAVLTVGDVVYVGGDFKNIKNGDAYADPARKYIAAFNRDTGEPIPEFDIQLDGQVYALASSPNNDTLYVAGAFNKANGQNRRKFAAYELVDNTATLSSFRLKRDGVNINPDKAIREIALTNETVYLSGLFTKFGGNEDHAYVAAFDSNSGEIVQTFVPKPNKRVRAMVAGRDGGLWIGGDFLKVNGVSKVGLALVNQNTGELQASPTVPYPVIDLAVTPTQLFVASGGQNRTNRFTGNVAAAFDRMTHEKQWELQGNGNVQAVDVDEGRYVYFGGHYERFRYIRNNETNPDGQWIKDGGNVDRLSRHDKVTGEIDQTWLPFVDGIRSVNGIDVTTDGLYIVGDFFDVGGDTNTTNDPGKKNHRGFAMFKGDTD